MKTTKFNVLFVFILFTNILIAQEYKLGNVTTSELEEKEHPKEKDAPAAYLFKKGKTYFSIIGGSYKLVTELEVKIKIYKKEGFEKANHQYTYYIGNNAREDVSYTNAITYNLVNGVIEKTNLKKDGEFIEETTKLNYTKKIIMPNVKEGSIIEYKMKYISQGFYNFDTWYFQYDIPVNYSKYITEIPEFLGYNVINKGYYFPTLNKERDFTNNTAINRATYIALNVPSLKVEKYVNNINNYRAAISHELSVINPPNGVSKSFNNNWNDVTSTIYKSDSFGYELSLNGYFEDDIKSILLNKNTRDEKISAILNYVKTTVKWNERNGYFTVDGVKKAYKDKKGNVAEINLMLTAMLRHAGIEANPVLISTSANGIVLYPSLGAFNYVICAVEIPDAVILLDATNAYSLPNILPTKVLNWEGRLIRKEGSSTEVSLFPNFLSREINTLSYELNTDTKIKGMNRTIYSQYNAYLYRNENENTTDENYIEKLEKKHKDIIIENFEVKGKKELDENIMETYNFSTNGYVEKIGDKIYISPMLFYGKNENPFKQEKREYPIEFIIPQEEKHSINFKIPEGYTVEFIPEKLNLETGDNIGSFKFNIENTGNKIQIISTFTIFTPIVTPEYYEIIKTFFQKMVDKQMEKIVLKKNN